MKLRKKKKSLTETCPVCSTTLIWKDKFLGIAIDIYKKDDYNELIRYFEKKYRTTIRSDKNKKLIWITDNEVIIVNRFTTHLAQVQILCKELYDNMKGLNTK